MKTESVRQAISKTARLLVRDKVEVRQRGAQPHVAYDADGRIMYVNLPVIPDSPSDEFLDAVQGFCDHECAHVLFTNNKELTRLLEQAKKEGIDPKLLHNTGNIFEDIRIEREMSRKFRGSAYNLGKSRDSILEHNGPKLEEADKLPDPDARMKMRWSFGMVPWSRALAGDDVCQSFMDKHKLWPVFDKVEKLFPDFKRRLNEMVTSDDAARLAYQFMKMLTPPPPPPSDCNQPDKGGEKSDSKEKSQDKQDQPGDDDQEPQDEDESEGEEGEDESKGDKKKPSKGTDEGDSDDETPDEEEGEDESDSQDEGAEDEQSEGDEGEEEDQDADDEESDESEGEEDGEGGDDGEDQEEPADESPEADQDDPGAGDGDDDQEPQDEDESEGEEGEDESKGDEPGESDEEDGDQGEAPAPSNLGGESDDAPADMGEEEGDPEPMDAGEAAIIRDGIEDVKDADDMMAEVILSMIHNEFKDGKYHEFTRDFDVIETIVPNERTQVDPVEQAVSKVSGTMQKDLQRIITARSQATMVPGYRRGRINPSALHRLETGDDRVFRRKHENTTKDVAVQLVIDLSGSMSGTKHRLAVESAWAFSSVLDRLNIPNEVIGFTTIYDGEIYKYREEAHEFATKVGVDADCVRWEPIYMPIFKDFGEKFTLEQKRRFASVHQFGPPRGMSSNIDGASILYAAARVLPRREKRKLMIVFSDGQPAGTVNGGILATHLKWAVQEIEKNGVETIGVGIMDESVKRFYPKSFVVRSLEELPGKVLGELKAFLTK